MGKNKLYTGVCPGGEIKSIFRHFTKFNVRKTDSSQNSMSERWTLNKINYIVGVKIFLANMLRNHLKKAALNSEKLQIFPLFYAKIT